MSEYWVSRKKYFCKYCEIYIADDAPSRNQHENGLRHKGNKERFVRNLYKQGERRKKDLEEEKREMARVEQAANAAFARDVSMGHASSSATPSRALPSSSSVQTMKKPEKPESPFANYSTAQSLGITDPDAERIAAEAERRRTMGVVGEWETVAPPPPPLPEVEAQEGTNKSIAHCTLPKKREANVDDNSDDIHQYKVRKRVLDGLGEIWDPGDIPIKLKSDKKLTEVPKATKDGASGSSHVERTGTNTISEPIKAETNGTSGDSAAVSERPKWTPKGWRRAAMSEPRGEAVEAEVSIQSSHPPAVSDQGTNIATGEDQVPLGSVDRDEQPQNLLADSPSVPTESDSVKKEGDVKVEPPTVPASLTEGTPSSMFRKRKIPAGNRGRR